MDASRKETVTRRVIYYLTSPAPYGEVAKAVAVAQMEYTRLTGEEPADDVPMISSYDNEVHVYFEVSETP